MPNTRNNNAVRLEFTPGSLVQSNLSGAAFTGAIDVVVIEQR